MNIRFNSEHIEDADGGKIVRVVPSVDISTCTTEFIQRSILRSKINPLVLDGSKPEWIFELKDGCFIIPIHPSLNEKQIKNIIDTQIREIKECYCRAQEECKDWVGAESVIQANIK